MRIKGAKLILISLILLITSNLYARKRDTSVVNSLFFSMEASLMFRNSQTISANGLINGKTATDVSYLGGGFTYYTKKSIGFEVSVHLESFSYKFRYLDDHLDLNGSHVPIMTNYVTSIFKFNFNPKVKIQINNYFCIEPYIGVGIFLPTRVNQPLTSENFSSIIDQNGNTRTVFYSATTSMTENFAHYYNAGVIFNLVTKYKVIYALRLNYLYCNKSINTTHVEVFKNELFFDNAVIYRTGSGVSTTFSATIPIR
jgi:hypothetical protein